MSQPVDSRERRRNRQSLSCIPCRHHKLKCDRRVPCQTCRRYRREDKCSRQHPTSLPSTLRRQLAPRPASHRPETPHVDYGGPQAHARTAEASNSVVPAQRPPNQKGHQSRLTVSLLPRIGSIESPTNDLHGSRLFHSESYWREQLLPLLPTRNRCDMLVSYFLENINWIYHALHVPTFRKEYSQLWDADPQSVDLSWLSLLFAIISESALFLSSDVAQAMGLPFLNMRSLSHTWYTASRQALHASGFEAQPQLVHIQTFIVTQLYWLVTKNVETLNSCLGQAVRNAQALGLNKTKDGPNLLQRELRRRVWWDLLVCDTFQSCCLERPSLIQIHDSVVPLPANCDDDGLTETSINEKPLEDPTEMSYNILRAKVMIVLQKLYVDNCSRLSSYEFVRSIDAEMMQVVDSFPRYYRIQRDETGSPALAMGIGDLSWAQHQLHCCICVQRIRMYRPFLHPPVGVASRVCVESAEDVLAVYSLLRDLYGQQLRQSPRHVAHSYQIYSAAVALAAILLVEREFPSRRIRQDIEMVITDLDQQDTADAPILAVDGSKLLRKMLDMCDRRDRLEPRESERMACAIAGVFGGEQTARNYLMLNSSATPIQSHGECLLRVGQMNQQAHFSSFDRGHKSTANSTHQAPPSHEELVYPPSHHVPTAFEHGVQPGLASDEPEPPDLLSSQWSDDIAFLNEFLEDPQWDMLAQQFLLTPRGLNY